MTDATALLIMYAFPLLGGLMVWRLLTVEPHPETPKPETRNPNTFTAFLAGTFTSPALFLIGYYLCDRIITAIR